QRITDPGCDPESTGRLLWILTQFPPELGDTVQARLADCIAASMKALDDPELLERDKEIANGKIGSLGWGASARPPEEHDALGRMLLADLFDARPEQAGTLSWGIGTLKGLTGDARARMTESLLDALDTQSNPVLRSQYLQLVGQLAKDQPLDASFYAIVE